MARKPQITVDCADPATLGAFWAAALDYVVQPPPEGLDSWPEALTAWGVPPEDFNKANAIVDPSGVGPRLFFQRVPEAKVGKNRLHLDVPASDGVGTPVDKKLAQCRAVADELVALGATVLETVTEMGSGWIVLQDPEGNEFCVV
ncbi:MAG: hypothetical protein JWO12_3079 [Frankiales bacterium]|nr:hypothetical protein [Frankiales bacterium]